MKRILSAGLLLVAAQIGWAQETVRYVHTDALGSPVAYSNAAGVVTERIVYEPYGNALGAVSVDGPGFTGHVRDGATLLSYMQQRYMDPQLGMFLSMDPVTVYEQPVAQFNRYRYANNNPYKFVDPDGRQACDGISTCRVATEERLVASGQMTQEQKQANDQARGVGAVTGVAMVVAARVALAAAPVLIKAAVKEGRQEVREERKQRNAPPGPDPAASGRPHSRIERSGPDGQYTTHNGDGTYKQYRGSGQDHGNIPRPNVKETHLNTAPNGQQYPSKPEVRPARPEEIPGG